MRKSLFVLCSGLLALCLQSHVAVAAEEQLTLDVSGHFKGYGVYTDQDERNAVSLRDFDTRKETEVHFSGEMMLDNGLTVGAHLELDVDRGSNGGTIAEETSVYFKGDWGKINLGEEDGAAYLLQVSAPSADGNIDGLRQYINAFNYDEMLGLAPTLGNLRLDYDQTISSKANKITYFTPVYSGLQLGFSYIPSLSDAHLNGLAAAVRDDTDGHLDNGLEFAARYERSLGEVDFRLGAGYSHSHLENDTAGGVNRDDRTQWNSGFDINWGAFGFGAAYVTDDNGNTNANNADTDIYVLGADYKLGDYKLGVSYLNREDEANATAVGADLEFKRLTGGVTYSYGPGMSFRGSISHMDVERNNGTDGDGAQVVIGTQVNF